MRQGVASLLVAAAVGGCGLVPPADLSRAGDQMETTVDGTRTSWTLHPWPFDDTTAFLCLGQPDNFDTSRRENPDPESCLPLEVERGPDAVRVTFDAAADPAASVRLTEAGPPWVLAVAGRAGLASAGSTRQIVDSPVPSDPGPN